MLHLRPLHIYLCLMENEKRGYRLEEPQWVTQRSRLAKPIKSVTEHTVGASTLFTELDVH